MNKTTRVRFAPSPTGFLHVGGLRTALYNYLYARKNNGTFILRIEDTDRTRYVEGAVESLLGTLKTIGLEYDEGPRKEGEFGPYYQSQRTTIYHDHALKLVELDQAYYCFCAEDTLTAMREQQKMEKQPIRYDGRCRVLSQEEITRRINNGEKYVIRSKTPRDGIVSFNDTIRGEVSFKWNMVDDQVLIKSDGFPTYHLANVVDDHLMKINHVIRGEEWLTSTPKHIFLYQALGWDIPVFAHLPLLLNPDKSKLSKRQGHVAVEDFLQQGFLPEALLNFVALLGWHDANDREIFSLPELEEAFSLDRINKAGAVFDIEKLTWMNGQYLRKMEIEELAEKAKHQYEKAGISVTDKAKYHRVVEYARERINLLPEIIPQTEMFYRQPELAQENLEFLRSQQNQDLLKFWLDTIGERKDLTDEEITEILKKTSKELGMKGKDLYFPLRLALFGREHGPNIPIIYQLLGHEEFLVRLQKHIA